ncbi:protein BTG3 [Zootoca vivipara]|uniref:protein BTG3 n=1 Tax=Zootoca vivipara TaxID=8524 RepID=UPI001591660D|nr:protein BTG3 [Zootoca vivipara]
MKEEVEKAVWFISRVMDRDRKLEKEKLERFRESLTTILCERYKDHWYPEKPCKGQAYRCIRINRQYTKDDAILKACMESDLDYSALTLKGAITIWIDPGEVSCRLGENNRPFTVKEDKEEEEERRKSSSSGKATPESETSDYHSESPSESPCECASSSEDEGPGKRSAAKTSQIKPGGANLPKQEPHRYRTPSPLWVPHPQGPVFTYFPLTYYYVQPTMPVPRRPNPNMLKRLTKRASKS